MLGPWQYLRKLKTLRTNTRRAVAQSDAYILRAPGLVARLAWHEIRRLKKSFCSRSGGRSLERTRTGDLAQLVTTGLPPSWGARTKENV